MHAFSGLPGLPVSPPRLPLLGLRRELLAEQNAKAYLRCIEDELPDRPITGFRYETLTDDPAVRKGVDDILFNLCGEENPRQLEDYETPDQGMKMGGIGT